MRPLVSPVIRPVLSSIVSNLSGDNWPAWLDKDALYGLHAPSKRAYVEGRLAAFVNGFDAPTTAFPGNRWRVNTAGSLIAYAAGEPRVADGSLLVEGAGTNLFLNSDSPATQTITISATGDYTLAVYGSGSVAIAANTATGTGFGTATNGSSVTVDITGTGTVDCTVTGSPTIVQLEAGTVATSPIVTAATTVTRSAEVPLAKQGSGPVPYPGYVDDPGFLTATFKNLPDSGSDRTVISLSDGTTDEQVKVHVDASDDLILTANTAAGTPATATIASGIDLSAGGTVAVAYGPYYADLPGASGDYISTPDSAALAPPTSTLDLIAYVALDDWTPSAAEHLIGQWGSVSTGSYILRVDTNGLLRLFVSTTGSDAPNALSTAAVGAANGEGVWVRVLVDIAASTATFYTSTDAADTSPTSVSWLVLGTSDRAFSASISAGIFNSTSPIVFGGLYDGTTNMTTGKVWRAAGVYDGTLAFDLNPQDYTGSGSTLVSATTGETWTLNGNTTIPDIARASFNGGAVATAAKVLDTSALTELHIACDEDGAEQLNGEIVETEAGDGAFTDAQLQAKVS